jgi:hypothetical protein
METVVTRLMITQDTYLYQEGIEKLIPLSDNFLNFGVYSVAM